MNDRHRLKSHAASLVGRFRAPARKYAFAVIAGLFYIILVLFSQSLTIEPNAISVSLDESSHVNRLGELLIIARFDRFEIRRRYFRTVVNLPKTESPAFSRRLELLTNLLE